MFEYFNDIINKMRLLFQVIFFQIFRTKKYIFKEVNSFLIIVSQLKLENEISISVYENKRENQYLNVCNIKLSLPSDLRFVNRKPFLFHTSMKFIKLSFPL